MSIVLIGMSGAGKSTIGVLLAKTLGYTFIDTDLVIQGQCHRLLQDILDTEGIEKFKEYEEQACLSVKEIDAVIATGGSVVYCEEAMVHLKQLGTIVYLNVPYKEIERRLKNIETRGIVMKAGYTLKDVYCEREELYNKYADITIDCTNKEIESIVTEVYRQIKGKKAAERKGFYE